MIIYENDLNFYGKIPVIGTVTGALRIVGGTGSLLYHLVHAVSQKILKQDATFHLAEANESLRHIGRGFVELVPVIATLFLSIYDTVQGIETHRLPKHLTNKNKTCQDNGNSLRVFKKGSDTVYLFAEDVEDLPSKRPLCSLFSNGTLISKQPRYDYYKEFPKYTFRKLSKEEVESGDLIVIGGRSSSDEITYIGLTHTQDVINKIVQYKVLAWAITDPKVSPESWNSSHEHELKHHAKLEACTLKTLPLAEYEEMVRKKQSRRGGVPPSLPPGAVVNRSPYHVG